jgi:hypothetical protein
MRTFSALDIAIECGQISPRRILLSTMRKQPSDAESAQGLHIANRSMLAAIDEWTRGL